MPVSVHQQVEVLMLGAEFGDRKLQAAMTEELRERLTLAQEQNRPLRVYAGYDPSKPDLHLGHSITMRKLRQFQDLGHEVFFVVGTFTAQVGDASDKTSTRPRLAPEKVLEAAKTYAEQCYRILDRDRTHVVYNGDWLTRLKITEFVQISSRFTVQQFLARDNFRRRLDASLPIALHEFYYALFQGYDAVHLEADVQIGATEQLFNILAGRTLQEMYGQRPCVCITYPILVGTDGVSRMSKSAGNYIGLAELPEIQYGKVMSISDQTMLQWIDYVTRWSPAGIANYKRAVESGQINPMEIKKQLAREVVSQCHGDSAADDAERHFENVHQKRLAPDSVPSVSLDAPVHIIDLLTQLNVVTSRSAARRLLAGNGVRANGMVISDSEYLIDCDVLLQVGKRRFFQIVMPRPR